MLLRDIIVVNVHYKTSLAENTQLHTGLENIFAAEAGEPRYPFLKSNLYTLFRDGTFDYILP